MKTVMTGENGERLHSLVQHVFIENPLNTRFRVLGVDG